MLKILLKIWLTLLIAPSAFGSDIRLEKEAVWNSRTKAWLTLEQFQDEIARGDTVVLGEQHAVNQNPQSQAHHQNQLRLLQLLGRLNQVSLGMEFLNYPKQLVVDRFVTGQLAEAEFLRDVEWSGNDFNQYRLQILEPRRSGGRTLALNIPRSVSSKVARLGVRSLEAEDKALLPPLWEKGGAEYFERFKEATQGHVPESKLQNYFWAHSLWDDTMAWKASEHRLNVNYDVLVIIVGEFHVEYGHGLPSRLPRHGVGQVKTMLQAEVLKWSEDQLAQAVSEHPSYGARADYIWVYKR